MPAIFFDPEGYKRSSEAVLGRRVAGEGFLRALRSYSSESRLHFYLPRALSIRERDWLLDSIGTTTEVVFLTAKDKSHLANAGGLFFPGPNLTELSRNRANMQAAAWPISGVTHTTASARVIDELTGMITAPVQPWDALICTSQAVKSNVERLMQAEVDRLKDRLGIQKLVLPRLPVIPLGIHPDDFQFPDEDRAAARLALGAGENTRVVVFVGRLSFHAKANPLAMYQALERAAKTLRDGEDVVLVECGWHANDGQKAAFEAAAKLACPSVRVVTLDGRVEDERNRAWAAADVFCSLSDNIQETFGITPIEAMAAGLPVVVSDWDGYKETVRDGVDGFRIPTLMPAPGLAGDLAMRHGLELDTYDMYCGQTSALIAVDIDRTADAFSRLFASEDLRRQMGAAGRQRARDVYDWKHIIPVYEQLWNELDAIRKSEGPKLKPSPIPWPARPDPFHAFAAYPTTVLGDNTVLELAFASPGIAMDRIGELMGLLMVNYTPLVIPSEAELDHILQQAAAGPKPALALVQDLPDDRKAFAFRGLAWLVKIGILKVSAFKVAG
ncbi:glycosyl transferase family 1 [Roseibium hamelinense]|uniref:Glycosyl transferase family 1 n=1 Tax=Roseibium hamelinense TaxID=150831 RepID=A0A562T240_9HYPH|nr:glycosyltransferase family 4 protein [Roseibium hamelinense]MTI44446.1 glycosyltransferase [Roseibium hamelinense]TWI87413.1 glycosyl transferase family 1 [Roseibium hamelinense]